MLGLVTVANSDAAARFPRVVAFGEMVSLLWSKGRHDAALHLEELWNDLAICSHRDTAPPVPCETGLGS
jgi:hypothetical protein